LTPSDPYADIVRAAETVLVASQTDITLMLFKLQGLWKTVPSQGANIGKAPPGLDHSSSQRKREQMYNLVCTICLAEVTIAQQKQLEGTILFNALS